MDTFSLKLTVRHWALVAVLAISAIAAICYAWAHGWKVTLDDVVKILALGAGVATAVYAAMTMDLIYAAHRETTELKRKEFAAHLIERWQGKEMVEKLQAIDPFVKVAETMSSAQARAHLETEVPLRHACLSTLNFFEELAIAIAHGLADEPILKAFFRGVVVTYFGKLKHVVEGRRAAQSNMRIYIATQDLAEKWGKS